MPWRPYNECYRCKTTLIQVSIVIVQDPLKVSLFYESYCPGCIQFIEEELIDVYKLFENHIQLELLPYGNEEVNQQTLSIRTYSIRFSLDL